MILKYKNKGLGNFLLERGLITREELEKALQYKKEFGYKRIGEILWEIDILGEEEVLSQLADYMGVQYVILREKVYPLMHQSIFDKKVMLDCGFAPFDMDEKMISIAIGDINSIELREMIENLAAGYRISYYLSLPGLIRDFIEKSYSRSMNYLEFKGKKDRFGEYLVKKGLVDKDRVDEILKFQQKFSNKRFGELLYETGTLNSEETLKELAAYLDKQYETLHCRELRSELSQLFDRNFMKKKNFVPFDRQGNVIKIAMGNIFDFELTEMIETKLEREGLKAEFYLSLPEWVDRFAAGLGIGR